tara:strand:+ start:30245 stop:33004 length:2760 start_codon:yes stop_codon:yes gene_type:complete
MKRCIYRLVIAVAFLGLAACSEDSVEDHIANAETFLASKQYNAAAIELKNALQKDESSAKARWLLGNLYLQIEDTPTANKELRRAQDLGWNPNDVRPALAKSLLAESDITAVLVMSTEGLEADAAADVLATQALAALTQGQAARAQDALAEARQLSPQSTAVMMAEARLLFSRGELDAAVSEIDSVIATNPESGLAWSLRGDVLMSKGDLTGALESFDQSIKLRQFTYQDRLKRALINLQSGDYEAGQVDVAHLLKVAPQHPASNYLQGLLHFRDKEFQAAITSLSVAEPAADNFPMVLYYLGNAHLQVGNADQAAVFANQFYQAVPDSIAGRKLLATIRLQDGDFAQVRALLDPVLSAAPDDISTLNLMANALLRDGQTQQGIDLLQKVANLQPDSAAAQVRLGAGLLMTGNNDKAAQQMENALNLDPQFQQADILLVLNKLQNNDIEGAIGAAQAYQQRNPDSSTPYNLLGRVYVAAGQPDAARAAFAEALLVSPGEFAANHNLAVMELADGNTQAARSHYETVLKTDESSLAAMLQLTLLDARDGNTSAVTQRLDQAIKRHPTALEPRLMLARAYIGDGKADQVPPLFSSLDDMVQKSPQVLQVLGMAQMANRQHEEARYTLQQLINTQPGSAASHHMLAMAHAGAGDTSAAKQELLRAIELDSNYLPSLITLSRLSLSEGDYVAFRRHLARAAELAPDAADVLRLQAVSAREQGDLDGAITLAEQAYNAAPSAVTALELNNYLNAASRSPEGIALLRAWIDENPSDVTTRLALAEQLLAEDQSAAIKQNEAVLDYDPKNLVALNNLGWLLRESDTSRARGYVDRAIRIAPDRPEVLDTLAMIDLIEGDGQRALRNIRRAAEQAPGNPSIAYHQALIMSQTGEKDSARRTLQTLLGAGEADFAESDQARALLESLE